MYDVLVIGSGFGGLGASIALAESGARVCLCESLRYPGGCASTFEKEGFAFDAGATLVSGLAPGQLFGSWLTRYAPETVVDWMDPLVEVRSEALTLVVGRERQRLVEQFCALPGAPAQSIRKFFAKQAAVAEPLWEFFDDPGLLPPFSARSVARHASRVSRYLALTPLLGRSLLQVLDDHGLSEFAPLRLYADALCQITVQCAASDAEATFALAAMDYYYRGAAHVRGGVGTLAVALLAAARQAGATAFLSNRVRALRLCPDGTWLVGTRRGELRARAVVANLLPAALEALLDPELRSTRDALALRDRSKLIDEAWGAAMLYIVARAPEGAEQGAHHLQLVDDARVPLAEGNHVFVSVSHAAELERAPPGCRTLTVSTHVPLSRLREAGADGGRYVEHVQERMRHTLRTRAPEWFAGIERTFPASPRTFARFVGRPSGAVGGVPRRVGLGSYVGIGPQQALPGVWLVGDSVFPGQSALATATGGVRTAAAVSRVL